MCGIAGFIDLNANTSGEQLESLGRKMAEQMIHRGPDDGGVWASAHNGLVLSHRRLAVIDLSSAGHQPMASRNGQFVIAYNGEIYNFRELRSELQACGAEFHTDSDTEVLLEGIATWGLKAMLSRCIGMFAFALWDKEAGVLSLARDRLGIKPLYVGTDANSIFFGSELKALRPLKNRFGAINATALAQLIRDGFIAAPNSIHKNIQKLEPGCIARFQLGENRQPSELEVDRYWALEQFSNQVESDEDSHAAFERLLTDAVRLRMVSDVPSGAFLSGGIDSSVIVALMQSMSSQPVRTFTIGFAEESHSEAQHAARIAKHLGTDHTEQILTAKDSIDLIPKLPEIYDEPFGDSSQLPTLLVSQLAREHVTVTLSGDGGDELFGGYERYARFESAWKRANRWPTPARHALAAILSRSKHAKRGKLAALLASTNGAEFYWNAFSSTPDVRRLLASPEFAPVIPTRLAKRSNSSPLISEMMFADASYYLPDDILTKVDRASMSTSLEVRVPMIDHRIIELVSGWSIQDRVSRSPTKQALRSILSKHVPAHLYERPKQGFGIPIAQWLRGPLREWAEDLMSVSSLVRSDALDATEVRRRWCRFQQGDNYAQGTIWSLLAFQAWYAANS